MPPRIGVLALQGAFIEHVQMLQKLGAEAVEIRLPGQLEGLDGLIIPGGESTTIGKLAVFFEMMEPLKEFGRLKPIWGTCAGAIFLSKDIHREQPLLELMDITIQRNAFGRQVDSFEVDINVPVLEEVGSEVPFPAVFIRAPLIEAVHADAKVLSTLEDGSIIAARQGHWLATVFHPEISGDTRFHQYFLNMCRV